MMIESEDLLYSMLLRVRNRFRKSGDRLVLAESCTAGLVSSYLGQIPGVSEFLCGSMVVYRTATKTDWLGIPPALLTHPDAGPVSDPVTRKLAWEVLARTPEASVAAAVTGHLGPGSPLGLDGVVFFAIVHRGQSETQASVRKIILESRCSENANDLVARQMRQSETAFGLLEFLEESL